MAVDKVKKILWETRLYLSDQLGRDHPEKSADTDPDRAYTT